MKNLYKALQCLGLSLALLALSGCYEVIPQDVEEHIVIHRDGRFEASYSGTFRDLLGVLGDGVSAEERAELERAALRKLQAAPALKSVKKTGAHTFLARFEETGSLSGEDIPPLLGGLQGNKEVAPTLIGFKWMSELENGYEADAKQAQPRKDLQAMLEDSSEGGRELKRLVKSFHGVLTIEIDADLVGEHNAQSVNKSSSGMSIYRWKFDQKSLEPAKFTFFFGAHDRAMLSILRSPPGSDCMKLIGGECKCGPFVLVKKNGDPLVNAGYEILVGSRKVQGCSNASGETQSVLVKKTSSCEITVLNKEQSSRLCPKKK